MDHPQPHLSGDLRLALSVLYSLPPVPTTTTPHQQSHQPRPTSHQAHEYLMQFQSRNIRRKLSSKVKSIRQKNGQVPSGIPGGSGGSTVNILEYLEAGDIGSSWLACLALLACYTPFTLNQQPTSIHYAEALFATQTMVHRLRKVKNDESIDLEFEASPQALQLPPSPEGILGIYMHWIAKFGEISGNAMLPLVLQRYQASSTADEDTIKGELTVLTLTTLLYAHTQRCHSQETFARIRPLLSTIASAISVAAARLRYTSISVPSPAPNTQPIVQMILQTLSMVHQVAISTTPPSPEHNSDQIYSTTIFLCMSAVPDAILAGSGSGGGAHGRMSIDPRCFTAITAEVRTQGLSQLWEIFQTMPIPTIRDEQCIMFLEMCESWAKYVPLPTDFARRSVDLIEQAFVDLNTTAVQNLEEAVTAGRAALRYWISIMEGGAWTVDEVLAAYLIQKNENSQQPNKKRQSSKSKKRQKEALEERTSQQQYAQAQNEVHHRSEIACEVTMRTWNLFRPLLTRELSAISDLYDDVQGDGPVGGIIACANACLPCLVRQPIQTSESVNLFIAISTAVNEICSSPARSVRGFAAESLYMLHDVVGKVEIPTQLQSVIVDHYFKCCMSLARQCAYPSDYFNDLCVNNDEDWEIERNDARDVLRALAGYSTNSQFNTHSGTDLAFQVLVNLIEACSHPILEAGTDGDQLFPESALHAFSALARPISALAVHYQSSPSVQMEAPLNLTLDVMCSAGQCISQAFGRPFNNNLLPLSRLYSLATASLSPAFSALGGTQKYESSVTRAVGVCFQASVLSSIHLPELSAPSTLRSSRFDVRGAMRSPGGEDHVSILALMRLATESPILLKLNLQANPSMVSDLCHLYQQLKQMEKERGKGVLHGKGVLPKSRRILLGIICHIEQSSLGQTGALNVLEDLFKSSVLEIVSVSGIEQSQLSPEMVFGICENVFDLSAFSKDIIQSLYDFPTGVTESPLYKCLTFLNTVGNVGFDAVADQNSLSREFVVEWNRLRAAIFVLVRSSSFPDLPNNVKELVRNNVVVECNAALHQCKMGPSSRSVVFNDEIISGEVVPAGLMIEALGEALDKVTAASIPLSAVPNIVGILFDSRSIVLQTITAGCPSPTAKGSFEDPRPTIAETWYLSMNKLLKAVIAQGFFQSEENDNDMSRAIQQMLVDSFLSAVVLLLYPSVSKSSNSRANDAGMSFDNPQTLTMMDFLDLYFSLGSPMLQRAALELSMKIPVDIASLQSKVPGCGANPSMIGVSIIGSSLFRAVNGGLPPWAVEYLPSVYSSFFSALDRNTDTFGKMLHMAMHIRLAGTVQNFGGVQASQLLTGESFQNMGDKHRQSFLSEALELARKDNPNGWRHFKALVKKFCGGKKKDTDFNQKPPFTKWDCLDRI